MKTELFQSCDHCCIFQICWHIECSTFTASSVRIWNSSTPIPSPPLVLFTVMLSKAHLTSHSRMSGSRWVITTSWLSGSWRSFEYSSSVYSCLFIGSSKKTRVPEKKIYFCFIDYAKAFDGKDHNKLWKILREIEYQTTWPASWEIYMQVRKQQLELDVEQQTGSK